jgi:hypothetical protein
MFRETPPIGFEGVLGAHLLCADFAIGVHDLDGLGHGEDLPGRCGSQNFNLRPGSFKVGDDSHMIEVGVQNEKFLYFFCIDSERFHLRQHMGENIAESPVDQDEAILAFQSVDAGLFKAEVPKMIRDFSRLTKSHGMQPSKFSFIERIYSQDR